MDTSSAAADAAQQLTIVARQLATVIERLTDAAAAARGLAAATDWQARAATVFHERADAWAGRVSGLSCLAETAKLDATLARNHQSMLAATPFAGLFERPAAR